MTMVSTGPISLGGSATSGGLNQSVNVELGLSPTATISMNDAAVRTLFGKAGSGTTIAMNDGYGKANAFVATISTNQQEMNLRTWALANGWNGTVAAVITVAPGVYIWSNAVATPAMTINGSWPGGITLVNQGFIMGRGGNGSAANNTTANPGGPAISLGLAVTIDNTNANAYIGGGGGGGASGSNSTSKFPIYGAGGGGGAGGGVGGVGAGTGAGTGGAGGAVGQIGGTGSPTNAGGTGGGAGGGGAGAGAAGGGGGRIFPGTAGNSQPAGIPGGAANNPAPDYYSRSSSAGGGGWGAKGGDNTFYAGRVGGAGGRAVALNGFSVTWVSGNTTQVWGAVS